MDKEAKKLSWFDRLRLKAMMPNLKKYKRKYSDGLKPEDNYVLIKRTDYELMQKMIDRQDNYLAQIKMNNEEIGKLKDVNKDMVDSVNSTLEKLHLVEVARRKNAGKVGGLTTELKKNKKKIAELEDMVKRQQLESNVKDAQIKVLKSFGKKKSMKDYTEFNRLKKEAESFTDGV